MTSSGDNAHTPVFNPDGPVNPDLSTLLETPQQLFLFRLLQIKYALKIELRTGLRHSRGSVLKLANQVLMQHDRISATAPVRKKQRAYNLIDQWIGELTKDMTDDPA